MAFFLAPVALFAQGSFNDYFTNGVLRFDYILSGTSNTVKVTEVQQKCEPLWSGTTRLHVEEQDPG